MNVLEDDRFYVHDEDPLAGLGEQPEEPSTAETSTRSMSESEVEAGVAEIESLELDEPELHEPDVHEHKHEPKADQEDRDAEEEEQEEEKRVEKPRAPEQLKQSKLKVVPVRPTRPKPKIEPEQEPEREAPAQNEKRPLNPFQRQVSKNKPRDPSPTASPRVPTPPAEVPRAATPKQNSSHPPRDDNLVDLADWLREDASPKSYRMVAEDDKRVGEEQADFTDMLEKFKAGVAANVDDEDFDSHYDLGIAYREMGLIDEAIAEFQKGAARRDQSHPCL